MELAFDTRALRDICISEEKARKVLGASTAAQLKRLLSDLKAASSIEDLPLAKPRKNSADCFFYLSGGYKIVATINHDKIPRKSKKVDWTNVTHLKLLRIEKENERSNV